MKGGRLAEAIAAEKLDEFGNAVQPRQQHRQSRKTRPDAKRKRDVAGDIDTDVDENFTLYSSSMGGHPMGMILKSGKLATR